MEQEEEDEEEKEVDFNPSFCLIKSFCTINLKKQQNLNYNQNMKIFLTNCFKMFARTLRLETKRWAGLVPPHRFTFREKQEVKDDDITSSEVSLSSCRCLRRTSSR